MDTVIRTEIRTVTVRGEPLRIGRTVDVDIRDKLDRIGEHPPRFALLKSRVPLPNPQESLRKHRVTFQRSIVAKANSSPPPTVSKAAICVDASVMSSLLRTHEGAFADERMRVLG